jgi:hypothetical protein
MHGLRESAIEKSGLDVCLMYQPASDRSDRKQDAMCWLYDSCKGFLIIDSLFLLKTSSYKARLVSVYLTVGTVFAFKYQPGCDWFYVLGMQVLAVITVVQLLITRVLSVTCTALCCASIALPIVKDGLVSQGTLIGSFWCSNTRSCHSVDSFRKYTLIHHHGIMRSMSDKCKSNTVCSSLILVHQASL